MKARRYFGDLDVSLLDNHAIAEEKKKSDEQLGNAKTKERSGAEIITRPAIKCEYLIDNSMCRAIRESYEGESTRRSYCRHEQKMTCCYLCELGEECDIRCDFLR